MGIAAEGADILPHPFEGKLLIGETVIAGDAIFRFGAQRRIGHKTQDAEAVIDGDDDGIALDGQIGGVVEAPCAVDEGAAMKEHHHRQAVMRRDPSAGHIEVEEEAIFIGARGAEGRGILRTGAAEGCRIDDARYWRRRHGPRETKRAGRRCGIAHAQECRDAVAGNSPPRPRTERARRGW